MSSTPLSHRPRSVSGRPAVVPGRPVQVVLAGGLASAALAYVTVRNPHSPGTAMPTCPFHWLTGRNCPGCGGLRMTHDLMHGDLAAAWHDNAVLLVLSPVLLFLLVRAAYRWAHGTGRVPDGRFEMNGRAGVALAVIGFSWMVVRNIGGW